MACYLVVGLLQHSLQFSITTPFPGTTLFEQMKKDDKIVSYEWENYDGNTMSVLKTEELSPEELKQAHDRAYEVWNQKKLTERRYKELSPYRLFRLCLREHGVNYTFKKALTYLKKEKYRYYINKKNGINKHV